MEYTQQFNQLIEKAASEKAFSLDVLKTINEMRNQFEAVVKENADLKLKLENCNGALSKATQEKDRFFSRASELEAMEKTWKEGLEKLSRDQFELDLKKSVADHGEKMAVSLFQTMFANTTFRKSVMRNVPSYYENGQYRNNELKEETETITEV